jgi:DNA-binding transcriptional LysR family regulator
MQFQRLRAVREVVRHDFSLTRAAEFLNTSQPSITRHLQMLEKQLGVELFLRDGKRFLGLSPAGEALFPIIERALNAIQELQRGARDVAAGAVGDLTIAASHTYARYSLPPFVERFIRAHPNVRLRLRQGHRKQIVEWLEAGEADVTISTIPRQSNPQLQFFPYYRNYWSVLVRHDHPLLAVRRLTFKSIAEYPIITYDQEFGMHREILDEFAKKGLNISVALSAPDADMIKTYVAAGLGIGLVVHTAYDKGKDTELRAIDVKHLFKPSTTYIGLRRGPVVNPHVRALLKFMAPSVAAAL